MDVVAVEQTPFSGTDPISDHELIDAIRADNTEAFEALIRRHHQTLVRLARLYTPNDTAAADVAGDTWLGALAELERFDGRVSFRCWLYHVLLDQVRKQNPNGAPPLPFSSTIRLVDDPYSGAVDQNRLKPGSDPFEPLHWDDVPASWDTGRHPEAGSGEVRRAIDTAIAELSPAKREVITLRDILSWEPAEAASALGITETNQRILLHRARSQVRNQLEEHLAT